MNTSTRYQDLPDTAGSQPASTRVARRRYRRGGSRLDKVLERNARWVAEARGTPPLDGQDAA
jgi:hypothetical protein